MVSSLLLREAYVYTLKLETFNDQTFLLSDFLDLSLDDVGCCIELVYTPMRKDGMRGNPRSILSEAIAPGKLHF